MEDDGLADEDIYVDFGDDNPSEIECELSKRVDEAETNVLSKEGAVKHRDIINKHKCIFRLRLGSGGPAKVRPMKIRVDDAKQPVRVKVRKHLTDQRKVLDEYLSKLTALCFIKIYRQASW